MAGSHHIGLGGSVGRYQGLHRVGASCQFRILEGHHDHSGRRTKQTEEAGHASPR